MEKFAPGEIAPVTGFYYLVDASDKVVDTISMQKGNKFPPTQQENYTYELKTH